MDEDDVKAKLVKQIVEGDRFQVDLARDKILTLHEAGLVEFEFKNPNIIQSEN